LRFLNWGGNLLRFNFNERFTGLKAELEEQLKEEALLNETIINNLFKIQL
jgi:type I restriction enzyme M protein